MSTQKRKSPQAGQANGGNLENEHSNYISISPRQKRVLSELLNQGLTFRDIIEIAPCNNGYSLISTIRKKFGLSVPGVKQAFKTKDGASSHYCVYTLSGNDRAKVKNLLHGGVSK